MNHVRLSSAFSRVTRYALRITYSACIFLLAAASLRAQSYTPVQYNWGDAISVPFATFPGVDNLTANGYGLWGTHADNWLLIGNELAVPGGAPYVPSGVVETGPTPTTGEVQWQLAASNLKGSTRFVSIDISSTTFNYSIFHITGLDDGQLSGGQSQINLTLPGDAILNKGDRNIIRQGSTLPVES
ncbi:MAG TPA: hypothetical protein VG537_01940, partial [Candidatus Kapabacteria bacterium]|nr:hypothetical protein [Candidatus Kapabacteria bacterium]